MTLKNKDNNKIKHWLRFLIGGIILFSLIYLFYTVARENPTVDKWYVDRLNEFTIFLLYCSSLFTSLFGYEVITFGKSIRIIDDFQAAAIFLDRGCMGRNVMIGFAALIAVFPGKFINKMWYIPMGIIILIFVNVLRISGLAITAYCCPQYSDINHYVVFKIVAWIVIFFLWVIWFNKFSSFTKKAN